MTIISFVLLFAALGLVAFQMHSDIKIEETRALVARRVKHVMGEVLESHAPASFRKSRPSGAIRTLMTLRKSVSNLRKVPTASRASFTSPMGSTMAGSVGSLGDFTDTAAQAVTPPKHSHSSRGIDFWDTGDKPEHSQISARDASEHFSRTGSTLGRNLLADWQRNSERLDSEPIEVHRVLDAFVVQRWLRAREVRTTPAGLCWCPVSWSSFTLPRPDDPADRLPFIHLLPLLTPASPLLTHTRPEGLLVVTL